MDAQIISNIILSTISFVLAAISVVTVVITLRQNHKMIENSTRPYITVYSRITNFQSLSYYLIVKNFGQSKATITKFDCNFDLSKCCKNPSHIPFNHLLGTEIMPGQSYPCTVDHFALCSNVQSLVFDIEYSNNKKTYHEHCVINIEADAELTMPRAATDGKELRNISYTLQDLVEKIM